MTTNSRQFNKYKDPVLSFDRLLERAGIMPPGRYRGFDTIAASANPVSGKIAIKLQHTISGVQVITKAGSLSDLIGIAITPQGTIIHEEGEVELPSLVVDFNQGTQARRDILVLEHTYQDNIPGENPPTYLIIKGVPADTPLEPSLTNPDTQLILGYLEVPVNTTTSSGLYYHPALVPEFSKSGRVETLENVFDEAATLSKIGNHTANTYDGITNVDSEGTCTFDAATNQLRIEDDGNIFKLPSDIPDGSIIRHIYPITGNWLRVNTVIFIVNNSTNKVVLQESGNIKRLDDGTNNYPNQLTLIGPHAAIAMTYNLGVWVPANSYIHRQLAYLRREVDLKAYHDQVYSRVEIDAAHLAMISSLQTWVTDNFEGKGVTPPPIPVSINIYADKTSIEMLNDLATREFIIGVQGGTTNEYEIISKPAWVALTNASMDTPLTVGAPIKISSPMNDSGSARAGSITVRSTEDTSKTLDISITQDALEITIVPFFTARTIERGKTIINTVAVSIEGSDQGFTATEIYVGSSVGWLTSTIGISPYGTRYVTIGVEANPTGLNRVGIIQLASIEAPSVTATITITQLK